MQNGNGVRITVKVRLWLALDLSYSFISYKYCTYFRYFMHSAAVFRNSALYPVPAEDGLNMPWRLHNTSLHIAVAMSRCRGQCEEWHKPVTAVTQQYQSHWVLAYKSLLLWQWCCNGREFVYSCTKSASVCLVLACWHILFKSGFCILIHARLDGWLKVYDLPPSFRDTC